MPPRLLRFFPASVLAVAMAVGTALAAADRGRLDAAGTVVPLKPFHVMAEWIQTRPMVHKDGTVQYITITHVTPRSPAAFAGIRPGSILVSVQGIKLRGLTLTQLEDTFRNAPLGDRLELGIADPPKLGGDEQKSLRIFRLAVERDPRITMDWAGHSLP